MGFFNRTDHSFYSIFVGDALLRLAGLGLMTYRLWSRPLPYTGPLLSLGVAYFPLAPSFKFLSSIRCVNDFVEILEHHLLDHKICPALYDGHTPFYLTTHNLMMGIAGALAAWAAPCRAPAVRGRRTGWATSLKFSSSTSGRDRTTTYLGKMPATNNNLITFYLCFFSSSLIICNSAWAIR